MSDEYIDFIHVMKIHMAAIHWPVWNVKILTLIVPWILDGVFSE